MRHVADELTALLDGALAPREAARVEAHLAECPACRAERDRLARALALLRELPASPAPSPTFEARFYARLAAERSAEESPGVFQRLAWRLVAPALAGAAATAGVFLYVGHQDRQRDAFVSEHLDLFESYEAVASVGALERPEDVQVVAHLDELSEGRP
jgi:anti-sigma factor RsiW